MIKLLQVYNQYRSQFNGEETVVLRIAELVEKYGGEAQLLTRSSRGIEKSLARKVHAAVSGFHSQSAYREMVQVLREYRPDVVHAHNLYPLLSPSVLVACRRARVPVVMTLHNHQLTCPRADHLRGGQLCERCVGGREYHCVWNNCRGNLLESVVYAARSAVARRLRLFHDNVDVVIALSDFAKRRLVGAGFNGEQIAVLPNMTPSVDEPVDPSQGRYFAFAGRLSSEKGVETLLDAATTLPDYEVRIAGEGPLRDNFQARAPQNVRFVGHLSPAEMTGFYRRARCLILPSRCFEMCPLVVIEAMSHGLPVIASDLGGREELVRDGVSGLLFQPGEAGDLARKMKCIEGDGELCRRLGRAGREMSQREFSEGVFYRRLMTIYKQASEIVRSRDFGSQHCGDRNQHADVIETAPNP